MKKQIFSASLIKMAAVLGGLFLAGAAVPNAEACTNLIVTKGASQTGSVMVSYSADSHVLYGALYHTPAAKHAPGAMRKIYEWDTGKYLGQIPQPSETYNVIGNMNEHQVLIGESTWGGLPQLADSTGILDYGSLMYVALERAKTAREALTIITDLVAQYGYASSGESITIADPNEVWVLEIIGKGVKLDKKGNNIYKGAVWVARRIPDGTISAHANQARITTFPLNDPASCLYSKDVISFAREQKLYSGKDEDFNFALIYNPFDFSGMRGCEGRVWSFFNKFVSGMDKYLDYAMGYNPENRMPLWMTPSRKLTLHDVAETMRDHYEGTPMDMTAPGDPGKGSFGLPYRWRPMTFKDSKGVEYCNERAIATQQTGWWYVGECRSWLPNPIGGVFWFGVDDAAGSPLTPFYCCTTTVPEPYAANNGSMTEYSPTSMFWLCNRIQNFAYMRYNIVHPDIKRAIDRYEAQRTAEQPGIDQTAAALYKKDPQSAAAFLNNYSNSAALALFMTWDKLDKYLLVKYIDGNIKKEVSEGVFKDNGYGADIPVMPDFPGYSQEWKDAVGASPAAEHLKVVQPEGAPGH